MESRFSRLIDGPQTAIMPKESLRDVAAVLKEMELNQDLVTSQTDQYCRVRIGKLLVPRTFKNHIEEVARLCNVSSHTVYQLLMIEAMDNYAVKLQAVEDAKKERTSAVNDTAEATSGQDVQS